MSIGKCVLLLCASSFFTIFFLIPLPGSVYVPQWTRRVFPLFLYEISMLLIGATTLQCAYFYIFLRAPAFNA